MYGHVCVVAVLLECTGMLRDCCTSRVYGYFFMIAVLLKRLRVFLRDNCTSRECTGMFA